jgi:hypothetical protein
LSARQPLQTVRKVMGVFLAIAFLGPLLVVLLFLALTRTSPGEVLFQASTVLTPSETIAVILIVAVVGWLFLISTLDGGRKPPPTSEA